MTNNMNRVSVKEERNSHCDNFLIIGDEVVGDGEEGFLVVNDLQGYCKLTRYDDNNDDNDIQEDECSLVSSFCSVTTADNESQDGDQQPLFYGELVPSNESYFIMGDNNHQQHQQQQTNDDGTSNSKEVKSDNMELCSNARTSTNVQEETINVYNHDEKSSSPIQNKHNEPKKGIWHKFFMDDLRLKDELCTVPIPDMTPE